MRRLRTLCALIAAASLAACGGDGEPTVPGPGAAETGTGEVSALPFDVVDIRTPEPGRPSLMLVGDSLGVGMARLLPAELPGWTVSVDTHSGIVAEHGVSLWRRHGTPHAVSAFSLFTNDDPADVETLEALVRESIERDFSRCVIWATIHAPGFNGETFDDANALLYRLEREYRGRLVVVPWAETLARQPELDSGDGVHPTDEGYAVRARLFADAVRRCAG